MPAPPRSSCAPQGTPPPEKPGDKVEQWTGPTGNFTLELMDGGSKLRMDGFVRMDGAGRSSGREIPMNATVPLGKGPQWDELRKHPAFLALAATVSGIRGEPTEAALQDVLQD
jgi:hypothetical protein